MSTPRHTQKPSTTKQLRYLRDLAMKTGQSFAHPQTSAEASREIDRLKKTGRIPAADRRRELREVSRDLAEHRGDAARVDTDSEIEGYGSSCRWRGAP